MVIELVNQSEAGEASPSVIEDSAVVIKKNKSTLDISVFGLGKVGAVLMTCLASAGHRITGVDVSKDLISAINARTLKSDEPGLENRLKQLNQENFLATDDVVKAVENSSLSFIIVPTPSNDAGGFSLRYVLMACEAIGLALKKKKDKHTVVVVSTILPGSSDHIIIPCLEKASGKKIGKDLGYCYNPAFIAQGEVMKGFEEPNYLLIGTHDIATAELIRKAHRNMVPSDTPEAIVTPIEAEITKLASNSYETMRVSFANMLMSLCTEIPGANVDKVTGALAHRIGQKFLKGAIPYGGPCWPRDNKAFASTLELVGLTGSLTRTVDTFNFEHGHYILSKLLEISNKGSTVGLLGLAYKTKTNLIEESFGINLTKWLLSVGRRVIGWDPLVTADMIKTLDLCFAKNTNELIEKSDTIVIVNPLPEISQINWHLASKKTVVDCWRCLPPSFRDEVGTYIPLGQGIDKTKWKSTKLQEQLRFLTT